MRRHLSYANVAATLAVVISMSGGALAADHYLINSTKQISPKVIKKLTGKRGPSGREGAQGKEGKEGKEGRQAQIPGIAWTRLSLENGWAEYSSEHKYGGVPAYAKDDQGFVHLTGVVTGISATKAVLATLPVAFRPASGAWVPVGNSNGEFKPYPVDIWIDPAGEIAVLNGTGANDNLVSLEGVEFYAG